MRAGADGRFRDRPPFNFVHAVAVNKNMVRIPSTPPVFVGYRARVVVGVSPKLYRRHQKKR